MEANLTQVFSDRDFLPYVEHLGVVSVGGKRDIRSQWPADLGAAAGKLRTQPGSSRIRWLSAVSVKTGWPQPGRRMPKSTRGVAGLDGAAYALHHTASKKPWQRSQLYAGSGE